MHNHCTGAAGFARKCQSSLGFQANRPHAFGDTKEREKEIEKQCNRFGDGGEKSLYVQVAKY